MNRHQDKSKENQNKRKDYEVADKVTDDKRMNKKGKAERGGRKTHTILEGINDD
ncbi:MAG: hypothetical protein LAT66_03995 [Alkalimonas sp.]|nr:hypothetical protein [Alkalimonas sp.]